MPALSQGMLRPSVVQPVSLGETARVAKAVNDTREVVKLKTALKRAR